MRNGHLHGEKNHHSEFPNKISVKYLNMTSKVVKSSYDFIFRKMLDRALVSNVTQHDPDVLSLQGKDSLDCKIKIHDSVWTPGCS